MRFTCPESLEGGEGPGADSDDVTDRSHQAKTGFATKDDRDTSG